MTTPPIDREAHIENTRTLLCKKLTEEQQNLFLSYAVIHCGRLQELPEGQGEARPEMAKCYFVAGWQAALTSAPESRPQLKLQAGHYYFNGRGDCFGPMDERAPGKFLDQYGTGYDVTGLQWDHVVGSTGNLVAESENTFEILQDAPSAPVELTADDYMDKFHLRTGTLSAKDADKVHAALTAALAASHTAADRSSVIEECARALDAFADSIGGNDGAWLTAYEKEKIDSINQCIGKIRTLKSPQGQADQPYAESNEKK